MSPVEPRAIAVVVSGCVIAVLLGLVASSFAIVLLSILTMLPLLSHVRWVGWRRALTEPSAVTIIIFFYLCVFPQRGLAIAAGDYRSIDFTLARVTGDELALMLILASLGTTVVVECFHFARRRAPRPSSAIPFDRLPAPANVIALASIFAVLAIAAFAAIVVQNHGLAGTAAVFFSHSKEDAGGARSFSASIWAIVAVPAVWCAALVALQDGTSRFVRLTFVAVAATVVLAQLVIFGSRLSALLAIMGAWLIAHALGRRVPIVAVLAAIPALIVVSLLVLAQRPGSDFRELPRYERYSRVVSYGVLDVALAVEERPGRIRERLIEPTRWLNFPLYLVPSPVWPDKPRIDAQRLDVFVVQAIGRSYQQDTGFPATYITEMRLYGGWPSVLIASALLGFGLGRFDLRLLGPLRRGRSPSDLLWYCTVITLGFTYYKDGDLLLTTLGQARSAAYLGVAMLVTQVWAVRHRPGPALTHSGSLRTQSGHQQWPAVKRGEPAGG